MGTHIQEGNNQLVTEDIKLNNSFGVTEANYVEFNTTYSDGSAEGRLQWNTDDGTLEVGLPGGSVNLQIGQEHLVRVKAGEAISNGDVVYVSSASGQRPVVMKADNTNALSWQILGVATEAIASSQTGYITSRGFVRDLNTSAFSDGDKAYLGTSGGLATSPPAGTNGTIVVGKVSYAHATEGILLVEVAPFSLGDTHNGTLRSLIKNASDGVSAAAGFTAVNDLGYFTTVGIAGSGNTTFPNNVSVHYAPGYGDHWMAVDGNKDFVWFTDPTDSHNNSSLTNEVMRLKADGSLNLYGTQTIAVPTATKSALVLKTTDDNVANPLLKFLDDNDVVTSYYYPNANEGTFRVQGGFTGTFTEMTTLGFRATTRVSEGSTAAAKYEMFYNQNNATARRGVTLQLSIGSSTSSTANGLNAPIGGYFVIANTSSNSIEDTVGGWYGLSKTGAGTQNNHYANVIGAPLISGGTLNNAYGLYVQNQTTATNNWAIYTNAGLNRLGDQLLIEGSQDVVQQITKANASQTANLAEWQNSSGTNLSYFNSRGELFVNPVNNQSSGTEYSLRFTPTFDPGASVTYFPLAAAFEPKYNSTFSTTGGFMGNLFNPTISNTGSINIRALDISFTNSSTASVPNVDLAYFRPISAGSGSINTLRAIFIADQTAATTNYAIYTNAGKLRFGDAMHLLEITTPTAIANHGSIYPKSDNKLYFQDGAGTEKTIIDSDDTVAIPLSLETYDPSPTRASETNLHGGILSLATGQPLDSVPTNIVVTKGIGKLIVVINAGSDISGSITVTGESIDRNTGASTPADTDTITVDALTTDGSDTDTNGNTRHSFTGAYITSKWFTGSVTLSTADLTLTDVDVYHVSFEQFNDSPGITLNSFDANIYTTNVAAEFDAYLYCLEVTGDKCDISRTASLNVGADGETAIANKYWRLRKGNLAKAIDGTTDGIWADVHYSNSPAYIEDVNIKIWATKTQSITTN